jgi:hypothetical protein
MEAQQHEMLLTGAAKNTLLNGVIQASLAASQLAKAATSILAASELLAIPQLEWETRLGSLARALDLAAQVAGKYEAELSSLQVLAKQLSEAINLVYRSALGSASNSESKRLFELMFVPSLPSQPTSPKPRAAEEPEQLPNSPSRHVQTPPVQASVNTPPEARRDLITVRSVATFDTPNDASKRAKSALHPIKAAVAQTPPDAPAPAVIPAPPTVHIPTAEAASIVDVVTLKAAAPPPVSMPPTTNKIIPDASLKLDLESIKAAEPMSAAVPLAPTAVKQEVVCVDLELSDSQLADMSVQGLIDSLSTQLGLVVHRARITPAGSDAWFAVYDVDMLGRPLALLPNVPAKAHEHRKLCEMIAHGAMVVELEASDAATSPPIKKKSKRTRDRAASANATPASPPNPLSLPSNEKSLDTAGGSPGPATSPEKPVLAESAVGSSSLQLEPTAGMPVVHVAPVSVSLTFTTSQLLTATLSDLKAALLRRFAPEAQVLQIYLNSGDGSPKLIYRSFKLANGPHAATPATNVACTLASLGFTEASTVSILIDKSGESAEAPVVHAKDGLAAEYAIDMTFTKAQIDTMTISTVRVHEV